MARPEEKCGPTIIRPRKPYGTVQAGLRRNNNAGEMTDAAVADMTDDDWDRSLLVNLTAAFRCARPCIPGMKERKWGRIINISSQAAYTGSANHAHYAAAKSGLLGFTFSLAKELGTSGITVNVVSPARITTDMLLERMAGREEEWLNRPRSAASVSRRKLPPRLHFSPRKARATSRARIYT